MIVVLILAIVILPIHANDATTMAPGMLRITQSTLFMLLPGEFDANGSYRAYKAKEGFIRALNFGLGLELGLNDWITGGLQWVPGVTVWSSRDDLPPMDKATLNGLFDLLIGAKFQLVGLKAPLRHERLRLTLSPYLMLPLPGPDWKKETENLFASKSFVSADTDLHAWALGGRFNADLLIAQPFFIALFGDAALYAPVEKAALLSGPLTDGTGKNKYEYSFTFEFGLEPQYSLELGGLALTAGLPLKMAIIPRYARDGATAPVGTQELTIEPRVLVQLPQLGLPLEAELSYGFPIAGRGDAGLPHYPMHRLVLLLKTSLKVF
jgi:hypothetical protein